MFEGLGVVEGNLEGCGWNWVGRKGSTGEWPGQCEDGGNVEIFCKDSDSYVDQNLREQSNILYLHIDIKFEQRNTICDIPAQNSPQPCKPVGRTWHFFMKNLPWSHLNRDAQQSKSENLVEKLWKGKRRD